MAVLRTIRVVLLIDERTVHPRDPSQRSPARGRSSDHNLAAWESSGYLEKLFLYLIQSLAFTSIASAQASTLFVQRVDDICSS